MKCRHLAKWVVLPLFIALFLLCSTQYSIKATNMDELTYINQYYNSSLDHKLPDEYGLLDPTVAGLSLKLQRNVQGKVWLSDGSLLYMFNDPMFILDLEWYISNFQDFELNINLGWGLTRLSDYAQNAKIQMSISDIKLPTGSNSTINNNYITQTLGGKLVDAQKQIYSVNKSRLDSQIDYIPTSYHWSYLLGVNADFYNWENQLTIQYIQGMYPQNSNNTTMQFICHYTSFVSPLVSSICKSRSIAFPNFWSEDTLFIQKVPIINSNLIHVQFSTSYSVDLLSTIYGNIGLYLGGSLGILQAVSEAVAQDSNDYQTGSTMYTYVPNLGLSFINDFMILKFGLNLIEISLYTKI